MTTQRMVLGTLVGGLVLFFGGYLIFGLLFASFFATNAGSATGVTREPFNFVALALGQLAWGAALTLILGWARVSHVIAGMKTAGLAGLLFSLGIDLTLYATTNVQNLTASLVDPILTAILFALSGAAIASVTPQRA